MKRIMLCLFSLMFFFNCVSAQKTHPDYWDGVLYVKVTPEAADILSSPKNGHEAPHLYEQLFGDAVTGCGTVSTTRPFRTPALKNILKIFFTETAQTEALERKLSLLPFTVYVSRSPILRSQSTPNDVHPNQWYIPLIEAAAAWDITTGKASVKVAIVDDAVKISHPDLSPVIWHNPLEIADSIDNDGNGYIDDITGWDAANNDNDPEPPASHWMYQFSDMIFTHGTHCAGIAGAATNNNTGVASIGYGISIIPVKCTGDDAIIPLALDAGPEGIDYAIAAGADVISLSWGSAQNDSIVRSAVNAALDAGIIVVAAAGNDGNTSLFYPASLDGVISVGAITKNDLIASFSQRNNKVTLMAPGDSIWSCQRKNNGYMYLQGTSMACPMVAGLAGLLKSFDTTLSAAAIKACLIAGCDNIDALNPTAAGMMGAGRINALKSLQCLQAQQNISYTSEAASVLVYPNPASDILYLTSSAENISGLLRISDVLGKVVFQTSITSSSQSIVVNVSGLSEGIYILSLPEAGGRTLVRKILISR